MKNSREKLLAEWILKKDELKVKTNAFSENAELWKLWEEICVVAPMRFALVNLELPYDLAQYAQVVLASGRGVPHVGTYMVGTTLDFMHSKIRNKIMSWNIAERDIKWIPRASKSLEELKEEGFRLIGTSPNEGVNALDFKWSERDVVVIGGAKGLSRKNMDMMEVIVRIPCSEEVGFLTTPTVIPVLTYNVLHQRGLWK